MDVYNTRKTVSKGMVLCRYDNPKPVPVPGHTRYWISMVLPGPMSRLKCDRGSRKFRSNVVAELVMYGTQRSQKQ